MKGPRPNGWIVLFSATILIVRAPCGFAGEVDGAAALPPSKKLIAFGGGPGPAGTMETGYLRRNIRALEYFPVDGVLVGGFYKPGGSLFYLSDDFWSPKPWNLADFRSGIDDLKTTRTHRVTDNFLRLNVVPGHVDWFDETGWEAILEKGRIAATICKEGNLKGIFLDTEQYEGQPFYYREQKYHATKSFQEYGLQVRQRGRQLMRVVTRVYPEITLLISPAPSINLGTEWIAQVAGKTRDWQQDAGYGLLPFFLDGWLEESGKAQIFDMFRAYPWVYLNGELAGRHPMGARSWKERFLVEVTRLIKPDAENVLAVRVYNPMGYGGIWKSVKLVARK